MIDLKNHLPNIRRGVYISPSKKRVNFDFIGSLEFDQTKKIATQEIPLSNAWVVQDLGAGKLSFAIEMVFSGVDADSKCKSMIALLSEMGSGMLLHPSGENILCVSTGWKYQPAGLETINFAKLSVSFIKTLKQPFPTMRQDFEGDIELAKNELFGGSKSLIQKISTLDFGKIQTFKKQIAVGVETITRPFNSISGVTADISHQFFLAKLGFQSLLDIDAPVLEILQSVGNICSLIRGFDIDLSEKMKAYHLAIERIVGPSEEKTDASQALYKSLITSRFFAFKNSKFNSLEIAQFADENITFYRSMLEYETLEEEEAVQLLQALRLSIGSITAILERYPKCKTYVLPHDSTPINLAFELYGDAEYCGKIIDDNRLTTDEIFFLPKGRTVVYFG